MRPDAHRPPGIFGAAMSIVRKDMRVELRARSALLSAITFATLGVTIFFFAWDPTAVSPVDLAPGVLWVVFAISGLAGVQRSFGVEQPTRAMDALLAAPIEREAIYLGKFIGNLLFIAVVQAVALPATALLYNVSPAGAVGPLLLVVLLAALGLAAIGTLFAGMAVNTRLAELLLPLLALPFFVPIIIPAAGATARLLAGRAISDVGPYIRLLAVFDAVFIVACTLAYPYTCEE